MVKAGTATTFGDITGRYCTETGLDPVRSHRRRRDEDEHEDGADATSKRLPNS